MAMLGLSLSAAPVVGVAVALPARKTLLLLPSSWMVPVPLAPAALVTLPVMAPVLSVKASLPSKTASLVMLVRTRTAVLPAASVMPPLAETQPLPSWYCSALLAPVSVPAAAVPLSSVGVKLMAPALARSRLTSNTAYGEASLTVTLLTATVGVALAATLSRTVAGSDSPLPSVTV